MSDKIRIFAALLLAGAAAGAACPARSQETAAAPLGVVSSTAAPAQAYVVVKGDTLWDLAQKFYQDSYEWPAIAAANRKRIHDPNRIYPGQALSIPALEPSAPAGEENASRKRFLTAGTGRSLSRPAPALPRVKVAAAPEPAAAVEPSSAPMPAAPAGEENASQKRPPAAPVDWNAKKGMPLKIPPDMVSQYPSVSRVQMPSTWTAEGTVVGSESGNELSFVGDAVRANLGTALHPEAGTDFAVYRRDGLRQGDRDPDAVYLVKVGELKLDRDLGNSTFRFIVTKAGGPIEPGDLIQEESPHD